MRTKKVFKPYVFVFLLLLYVAIYSGLLIFVGLKRKIHLVRKKE